MDRLSVSAASLRVFSFAVAVSLWSPDLSSGILSQRMGSSANSNVKYCDPAVPLAEGERKSLLDKLANTKQGKDLIGAYNKVYGSIDSLVIQWDSVSYSQISRGSAPGRTPASESPNVVCIHLAKKLPDIEHLADLAHELVHATRLSERVLKGEGMEADEFVNARIAASGGEADAFAVECAVKREVLGHWDHFCRPYVGEAGTGVNVEAVVSDLYDGSLSASLTGEPYPVMLSKQFKRIAERRALNGILK